MEIVRFPGRKGGLESGEPSKLTQEHLTIENSAAL